MVARMTATNEPTRRTAANTTPLFWRFLMLLNRGFVALCGRLEVAGGTRAHREQIARELIAVYDPYCNPQKFDKAWKDHWIGEYSSAPTTAPLTQRGPDGQS